MAERKPAAVAHREAFRGGGEVIRKSRHPIWSWIIHTPWVLALLAILGVVLFFGSGAGNPLLQRALISRLEKATGGKVELRAMSIRWLAMRLTISGLVIHGNESPGTEPLFTADQVQTALRIASFWRRRISLDELVIQQPHVHILVGKNGATNVPSPSRPATNLHWSDTLFELRVRRLLFANGWILYNEVRTPLTLHGGDLQFSLAATGPPDHPLYVGNLEWQTVEFSSKRYLPVPVGLSAKFTLSREGFTLEQGVFLAGHSRLDAQAEMKSFVHPEWNFRYRGWLELGDIRETLRDTFVPFGHIDLRGEGQFGQGRYKGNGSYSAQGVALTFEDFHCGGLTSRGSYRFDNAGFEIPDFLAGAFDGRVTGRITASLDSWQFRAITHVEGVKLAPVLPCIEHRDFPIDELHWDALVSADTVETWTRNFKHFEIAGKSTWDNPSQLAERHQPIRGSWQFRYLFDPDKLFITAGEFQTPSSNATLEGLLAPRNSLINIDFQTRALEVYKDFIDALRSAPPHSIEAAKPISGTARWDGKILGPSSGLTFQGHVRGEGARYDGIFLDFLEGDILYSTSQLTLARGHARSGDTEGDIEGNLSLTRRNFLPQNAWTAEVNLEKAPAESVLRILGLKYPIRGSLTGQFHGRGTHQEPAVSGLFDLADGNAYGLSFNRLRGQLNVLPGEVRISDAELRIFPPGKESGRGAGIITGLASYRFAVQTVSADLVAAALPLENFEKLQSRRLPVGGQVTFRLKANGPLASPTSEGTFRVVDLKVGQEIIGSFNGNLKSDGATAHVELSSAMTTGELSGGYTLVLSEPYAVSGKVSIK